MTLSREKIAELAESAAGATDIYFRVPRDEVDRNHWVATYSISFAALIEKELMGEGEPVAWLKFRAAQHISPDGNVEASEWFETCDKDDIGDDGIASFPVFTTPQSFLAEYERGYLQGLTAGRCEATHKESLTVPEGYALVPKEPTVEMLNAWFNAPRGCPTTDFGPMYRAMIAAAPSPGKQEGDAIDAERYRKLKAHYLIPGRFSVVQYDLIPAGVMRYLSSSLDRLLDHEPATEQRIDKAIQEGKG